MNISIAVHSTASRIRNFLVTPSKTENGSFEVEAFDNTGRLVSKWYRESIVDAMGIVGLTIQQQN